MHAVNLFGVVIICFMLLAYLTLTTWLTIKSRSKTSAEFMVAARSVPAFVVGVLTMSEFVGAKSTVGAAQTAFDSGIAASWAVLSAAIGFPLFGHLLAKRLYPPGSLQSRALSQRSMAVQRRLPFPSS